MKHLVARSSACRIGESGGGFSAGFRDNAVLFFLGLAVWNKGGVGLRPSGLEALKQGQTSLNKVQQGRNFFLCSV
jgi:hypothetical protein